MARKATKPRAKAKRASPKKEEPIQALDCSRYIAGLYERYGQDLVTVRDQQRALYNDLTGRGIWCMFDDIEAELLYLFIREMGPGMALEIGSGSGWSTTWMLQALKSIEGGRLLSFDRDYNTPDFVPPGLTERWNFVNEDIRGWPLKSLGELDFLLVDTDHQPDLIGWIIEHVFPLVRPGGRVAVHDIFNLPTPAHGEAVRIFEYLSTISAKPYTPSHSFPEVHAAINEAREAAGIDVHNPINSCVNNPLLVFDVL